MDWTAPDYSTFADAVNVLKKYDLWESAPQSVRDYLENGTEDIETPKEIADGQDIYYKMVVKTVDFVGGSKEKINRAGINAAAFNNSLKR